MREDVDRAKVQFRLGGVSCVVGEKGQKLWLLALWLVGIMRNEVCPVLGLGRTTEADGRCLERREDWRRARARNELGGLAGDWSELPQFWARRRFDRALTWLTSVNMSSSSLYIETRSNVMN
jgi:hypothetical protein